MEKLYNHSEQELKAQELWQQHKTYNRENNPGPLYSIDTPPPTVSGSLHIGHIFSYTQTDIIARYKRMKGFSVFYPFGFDDNGLPTERFVEKALDISAHSLSRSEFIKKCLEQTIVVEEQFQKLWQRMGLSVDWSLCYSTISENTRKISQESFIRLYLDGYVYRKYEPALYCTTCRTSVAQAELDDVEKTTTFNDIIFTASDGTPLTVATTRPELLPSCVALLYHPDDARYKHLEGKHAITPIFEQPLPILPDEDVVMDKGSGLVMVSTFGDKQDIVWYKRHKLPYRPVIGLNGKLTKEAGVLEGLNVTLAREKVLELLKENNLLTNQKVITHSVNVHERCKKPIEYVALSQWFLNILEHKQKFLDLADQINWYPEYMKTRYTNWVEHLDWDWCLSRQRFFGIPFPVWHCTDCNHIILADIKRLPIDPQETAYTGVCPQCHRKNIVPDTDVMDTWNTSSLTPELCYQLYNPGQESIFEKDTSNFRPMSMRPQAHDIIRTWAFYTIVKSWMHFKQIPWKDIVISGHVLSDNKEKLSKSKEHKALTPEGLLERYPADAIRYWTASGSLGTDIAFSENQLKIGQKLITKLWNAFRFIDEHIKQKPNKPQTLGVTNEWILHQSNKCFAKYQEYLEGYEFSLALHSVEKFFWHDFCDNYLELIKDQLFKPEKYNPQEVQATYWTLYTVGLHILQYYAPFIPHITENLYQQCYKAYETEHSVHQKRFDAASFEFTQSAELMEIINHIVSQVRKLKTSQQLSLKTEIAFLSIYDCPAEMIERLQAQEALIKGVTHAHHIAYHKDHLSEPLLLKENESFVIHASAQV